uniref:Uncharacterized protein n=1 Tax=Anguilla anguilla TaxID=7936 RepID=A0A0E9T2I8_ANGAN
MLRHFQLSLPAHKWKGLAYILKVEGTLPAIAL